MAELFPALPTQVSLARQIECVERELKHRRWVYPRRVALKKMKLSQMREEIAVMEAVLATLKGLPV
jgi:hypothetical protein